MNYKNVKIGINAIIGKFVLIGVPPKYKKDGELKTVIGNNAIIRSHSVIYAGNIIGDNFSTGHGVMIRENNAIGSKVSVGTHSIIEHNVKVGNDVRIHSNVFIPEFTVLEEKSWIGPCVTMTNALHPRCPEVKKCLKGPTIGKNVKIGANSTILPYIKIGDNSVIGAGSVVTKNIPNNSVVVGNPAKIIKKVEDLKCPFEFIKRPYNFQK